MHSPKHSLITRACTPLWCTGWRQLDTDDRNDTTLKGMPTTQTNLGTYCQKSFTPFVHLFNMLILFFFLPYWTFSRVLKQRREKLPLGRSSHMKHHHHSSYIPWDKRTALGWLMYIQSTIKTTPKIELNYMTGIRHNQISLYRAWSVCYSW